MMGTKKAWLCATAVLTLVSGSCGRSGLYPVSGKVMYKGEPAAGASVHFIRQGGNPMNEHAIMGIVEADGSFTLVCGHLGSGAPPGEYDVLIEWKQVTHQAKGQPQKGADKLRGRYCNAARPLLHAVVKAEANDLPPFELTDEGPAGKK